MTKTIVHVNQHHIKFNLKHGKNLKPVFTIKKGKKNRYAQEVKINGPSKLVYQPEKPLNCGARCWIETDSDVECIGEMEFSEVCELAKKI